MTRTIVAIYEGGVLKPLESLDGIAEHAHVRVTVEGMTASPNPLIDCVGILPDEDADELRRIIADEFNHARPGQ
ncbi:MAG: antitoxin family protein [Phycisphaerae bacterium]|nr:antitoxin family protein [Phycisphaerae bacterium]